MTSDSTSFSESAAPLFSIVAWPPEVLDSWLRRLQERLGVRGFGLPHLNLRAPFQLEVPLAGSELVAVFREVLREQGPLEVVVKGWKQVPGVIFLECELSPQLAALHERLLNALPSSRSPYDGAAYRPHLTLALGVLPWAEAELWAAVQREIPPLERFEIEALSLTREELGEVQELHTYPLR